eukprot:9021666-Ditylum_brightwellii.AAC.1
MVGKILTFLLERQNVLKIAAGVGSQLDLEILSLILATNGIPDDSSSSFDCCNVSAIDYLKLPPNDIDLGLHLDEAIGK